MTASKDLLVITASNGENLKLARRFVGIAQTLGVTPHLLDLTEMDFPLYNPRIHAAQGIPPGIASLSQELSSYERWVICAPEYNGSIPPVFTSVIAWLSVQGEDFRDLFNGRPIAMASFSGGGGLELLLSLRIQLAHLGAEVIGRQLMSSSSNPAKDETIHDLLSRLMQKQHLDL